MKVRKSEIDPHHLCFGIVVPQIEKMDILAISFTSEKYPGRTPRMRFIFESLWEVPFALS